MRTQHLPEWTLSRNKKEIRGNKHHRHLSNALSRQRRDGQDKDALRRGIRDCRTLSETEVSIKYRVRSMYENIIVQCIVNIFFFRFSIHQILRTGCCSGTSQVR